MARCCSAATIFPAAHAHEIARLGIGIKTQVPSVFDGLSVRENIWLAASRIHPRGRANAVVDEMLERIGLTGVAERLVGQLAHGQRQWVELGIVLSTDPELILLDEPAAGMTHEEVHKTAELVREINRSKALIVVEHDMQFIRMIAKQVTVFNQGSVLVEDAVENILRNPLVRDIYLGQTGGRMMLNVAGPAYRLWPHSDPQWGQLRGQRRRVHRNSRPQRHGQDHAAARR